MPDIAYKQVSAAVVCALTFASCASGSTDEVSSLGEPGVSAVAVQEPEVATTIETTTSTETQRESWSEVAVATCADDPQLFEMAAAAAGAPFGQAFIWSDGVWAESEVRQTYEQFLTVEPDGTFIADGVWQETGIGPSRDGIFLGTLWSCLEEQMPSRVEAAIDQTRSLDGRQTADFEGSTAEWTFSPDSGLSIVIYPTQ